MSYCPGIADGGVDSFFGASAMRSQVVIIDVPGKQIGFAPQRGCDD